MRYLALLFVMTLTFAEENVLFVRAKKGMRSVYISNIIANESSMASDYLTQLHNLLRFDFAHNGYSEVKPNSAAAQNVIEKDPSQIATLSLARHTIRLELVHHTLKTTLFTPNVTLGQKLDDFTICGNIEADSEKIHQLADQLHSRMYNTPGIASLKIVFAGEKDLWVKQFDLLEPEQMTFESAHCTSPIFIPNSHEILYTSYKFGQPKLYHTYLNQTNGRPFVKLRGNQLLPSISPHANFVAFISDANGRPDLFLQQIDREHRPIGSPQQIYTHPTATQSSSSFSPDGSSMVFVSDQSGTPRIYWADLKETLKHRSLPKIKCLTEKNRENTAPAWSPDGNKIAYSAKTDGVRQIWIYDMGSGEERQLTIGHEDKENPTWAPNSLHIAYNTTRPTFDIYMLNLNDPTPVKLTSGPQVKHFPTWEQKKLRSRP